MDVNNARYRILPSVEAAADVTVKCLVARLAITPSLPSSDTGFHFAGYFHFGATFGDGKSSMHLALSNTGDWSIVGQRILNKGDYDLGFVAARWGKSYAAEPRFMGKAVEAELT